ncbi:MAG TPA: Stk1 family PASTA domain-containing Ser/Thr kinase [Rubrobacteraceae bacterium]|jgi:beta-lactam-binding protein with PASTA domain/tRNA A-37 threonylcarbamoyl transferase component Bud32|nr:Stk1 family PASTA domain-containing Ser/Thr kinase [Rubrobacteraceae bacterium]
MQQLVDNRYRLIKPLGSGGMADVYLAHDDILDRDVALKVMSTRYASDEEFIERFKREAQSAAALSHANIVSIFDRGESEDGTYYIAMEYLPGGTLKDRIISKGALTPRTAAAVALQIAEALCAAHERGVIHRDIKPHNILITESGDVKVTDFGIARAASSSTMTRTGSILGTAHYISPEQAMGEPVGPASDLYSLGVVLYEMLTGELPYDAETPLGIAMKHVNGHLQPPKAVNPRVPDGINAITCRLLAKDPEDRYASDTDLIEDLERVVAGLEPASATTELMRTRAMPAEAAVAPTRVGPPPPPARRNGKRRNAWPLALALLALLLLAPLAWAAYNYLNDQQQQAAMIAVPDLVGMTVEEAQNQVGNDFEIEVQREVRGEDEEGTIQSQQPSDGSRAEEGSTISVVAVGTEITDVPDVTGENRDAAEQTLQDAGFEVAVEEAESPSAQEGRVTDQNPQGGSSEEVGSQVTITVGTGPSTVEVPDLYGNTTNQAADVLADYELELGTVSEDYSDEVAAGQIFSQDPAEGESIEPGSSVDVTVSLGPEQVEVPEVYGVSLEQAQVILEEVGLNSTPVESTLQNDEPAGTALETEPSTGALVDPGSTVTLYYSGGPAEPTTSSPAPDEGNGENLRDSLRDSFRGDRGGNDGNNRGNDGGNNGGNNRGRDRGGGND